MKKTLMLMLIALTASLGACGDDTDGAEPEETPQEEACEHMAEGPAISVTGATTGEDALDATAEHTRVDLALVDDAGSNVGIVSYQADEAGEYIVFTNNDVTLAVLDANGESVAIEETTTVTECAEVALQHTVDLDVGTYLMQFGPTSEAGVSFVVEHGDHSGEAVE